MEKIEHIVLLGDIGGTHSRLSLANISKDKQKIIDEKDYSTQESNSLEELIIAFLKNHKSNYPSIGILGIPGPIKNNQILRFPNIPHWKLINFTDLKDKLNLKKLIVFNDFMLKGYGIQTSLKLNEDYLIINDAPVESNGPKLVIGPGTGLGMCYLLKEPENKYYIIQNSEGSKKDFCSKNEKYNLLKQFIQKEYGLENVSIRNFGCGKAFIPFYKFLYTNNKNILRDVNLGKKIDDLSDYSKKTVIHDINMEISKLGLSGKCPLCKKVLELFIEILGEIAGDLSLVAFPTGGLYLTGEISEILSSLIKESNIFMEHFLNKNCSKEHLKSIPIFLVKNKRLGMIGALECARRIIEKE